MVEECLAPGRLRLAAQPIVANAPGHPVCAIECLLHPDHPAIGWRAP
ncbi:MAG: hypothetical protein QN147_03600 [Armatimonadota bacterium]|nr:hypothetical protein [Armatimonadota bacterium]